MNRTALKKCFALLVAVLCTLPLVCCGAAPASSSSIPPLQSIPSSLPSNDRPGQLIFCSFANLEGENRALVARGMQDFCDREGITIVMHDSINSPHVQAAALKAFVDEQRPAVATAILCEAVDPALLQEPLARAKELGMRVFALGKTFGDAEAALPLDYTEAAELLAETAAAWIARYANGRAQVAVLAYSGGATPPQLAQQLEDALAALAPNATITQYSVKGTADAALQKLMTQAARPQVVLAVDDALALAAAGMLDEAGGTTRRFAAGIGGSSDALLAVEATGAFAATVDMHLYTAGEEMATHLKALLSGQPGSYSQPPPTLVAAEDFAG